MKHFIQTTIFLLLIVGLALSTNAQRKTVDLRITQRYDNGTVVIVDTTFVITKESQVEDLLDYFESQAPEVSHSPRYRPIPQVSSAPKVFNRRTVNPSSDERLILGLYPDESFRGEGIRVRSIIGGTAAEGAGLKAGDIITHVDGWEVQNTDGLRKLLNHFEMGEAVVIEYERRGETYSGMGRLTERIPDIENRSSNQRYYVTPREPREPRNVRTPSANSTREKRVLLGVYPQSLTRSKAESLDFPDDRGVYLSGVVSNSGAAEAGLRKGDIITRIDGQWVDNTTDLRNVLRQYDPGEYIDISFWRNGRKQSAEVRLKAKNGSSSRNLFSNESGQNTREKRVLLGVYPQTLSKSKAIDLDFPGDRGVYISGIVSNSGAAEAGLRKGDIITRIDGQWVDNTDDLHNVLKEYEPGEHVELSIWRDGRRKTLTSTLRAKNGSVGRSNITSIFTPNGGTQIIIPRRNEDHRDRATSGRAYLGVYLTSSRRGGATITGTVRNGAAEDAGLRKGDRIIYINRSDIDDESELVSVLRKHRPGDRVTIGYVRNGNERETSVRLRQKR